MNNIKAVFFDFDGVLSFDRFYTTLTESHPEVLKFINETIFRGAERCVDRWMRGELSYNDINKIIADATGVSFELLTELFIQSVKDMTLNPEVIEFAKYLKQKGIPIALVTNNMDIFNEVTIPTKNLLEIFQVIVNSCDVHALKHEQDGLLFDQAVDKLGLSSYKGVYLIDDSEKSCAMFESKGGSVHRYTGLETFKAWAIQVKEEKEIKTV